MAQSNTERQALYRRRGKMARDYHDGLIGAVKAAIDITERAITEERQHGTRPNDGSRAGQLMAEQEAWVARQRAELTQLRDAISSDGG